ncbi:MAG: hypothetical protein ACFBSD_02315 [Paracoccaceae bacterium]
MSTDPNQSAASGATDQPEQPAASQAQPGQLSESGERFGVFYEIFEAGFRSRSALWLERAALAFMALVFVLLVYEAITYRLALME